MAEELFTLTAFRCPIFTPPSQSHLGNNKLHNIHLALNVLKGLILPPGGIFSFWTFLGEPTLRRGYKEGATFINRQVTTSPGGGLCQLSGVLYNLALLANFRILERHPHSIDAYGENRYIPLGRDATVAFGKKDLRFQNTHRVPVTFPVSATPLEVSGAVLATAPLNVEVSIEVSIPQEIPSPQAVLEDPGLLLGTEILEPGLSGKSVETHRVILHAGERRREFISRDSYSPTLSILRRGSRS